jgi:hypothetical protein
MNGGAIFVAGWITLEVVCAAAGVVLLVGWVLFKLKIVAGAAGIFEWAVSEWGFLGFATCIAMWVFLFPVMAVISLIFGLLATAEARGVFQPYFPSLLSRGCQASLQPCFGLRPSLNNAVETPVLFDTARIDEPPSYILKRACR